MVSWRKGKTGQGKGAEHRKPERRSLVAHRFFAPAVGLWGAVLGGLAVMVMPAGAFVRLTAGTVLAGFGSMAQLLFAGVVALALGAVLFALAAAGSAAARRRREPDHIVKAVGRKVKPIDPLRDLGTTSIDDPIETMPFATPAWRDAAVEPSQEEAEEAYVPRFKRRRGGQPAEEPEAQPEPAARDDAPAEPLPPVMPEPEPEPVPPAVEARENVPPALDLSPFFDPPTNDAALVDVSPAPDEPAPMADPVAPVPLRRRKAPPPPRPGTAALARLRAVPPSELSMAEMVERFAGALHEHRTNPPVRALTAAELAAREAALAEALKALAALSGTADGPSVNDAEAPLRAALRQLQTRRGAA